MVNIPATQEALSSNTLHSAVTAHNTNIKYDSKQSPQGISFRDNST
jgi:hypothetical protein